MFILGVSGSLEGGREKETEKSDKRRLMSER